MPSKSIVSYLAPLAVLILASASLADAYFTYPCDTDAECVRKYSASFVVCRSGYCHCSAWYRESIDGIFLVCTSMVMTYVYVGLAVTALILTIISVTIRLYIMRKRRQQLATQVAYSRG